MKKGRVRTVVWTLLLIGLGSGIALGNEPGEPSLAGAERLIASGRLADALSHLEQLHRDDPDRIEVVRILARVRAWTGDLAGALSLHDTLLEKNPESLGDRVERARVLAWMRRFDESRYELETIVEEQPETAEAWGILVDIQRWSGDVSEARRVALAGLEHSPHDASLLSKMSRLDYLSGNVGDARAYLTQALVADPQLEDGLQYLGFFSSFRFELSFLYEDISNHEPWRRVLFDANWRPRSPWSARLAAESVERFNDRDFSIAGAVTYSPRDRLFLSLEAQGAPGADIVPRWGLSLRVSSVRKGWTLTGGGRVLQFQDGTVLLIDGGPSRAIGSAWETGYRLTWARDPQGGQDVTHTVRLQWASTAMQVAYLDLFHGSDVERLVAAADSRTFTTTGLAAVWRSYLSSKWGIRLNIGFADRTGAYRRQSIGLGVIRHF